jgi:hypothetical protein
MLHVETYNAFVVVLELLTSDSIPSKTSGVDLSQCLAWRERTRWPPSCGGLDDAIDHSACTSRPDSIDRVTASPLAIAPPFRTLHKKYPVENLEEALAEGISTGHPTMPEFRFDPGQVNDFISFLKSLER